MGIPSNSHLIQRFVCRIHHDFPIDYENARVPIIAYKMSSLAGEIITDSIQGTLMAIY